MIITDRTLTPATKKQTNKTNFNIIVNNCNEQLVPEDLD